MAMSPFEIVEAIQTKSGFPLDSETESDYAPFMINKILSFTKEYIPYVEAMNACPDLPPKLQCLFYYHTLPRGKKYSKWLKAETTKSEDELLDLISETYSINKRQAEQYRKLLNDEQIEIIRKRSDHGGRSRA